MIIVCVKKGSEQASTEAAGFAEFCRPSLYIMEESKMIVRTLTHTCPSCGRKGTMTYHEPEHDSTGENTLWIEATGCWRVVNGTLINSCEESAINS